MSLLGTFQCMRAQVRRTAGQPKQKHQDLYGWPPSMAPLLVEQLQQTGYGCSAEPEIRASVFPGKIMPEKGHCPVQAGIPYATLKLMTCKQC